MFSTDGGKLPPWIWFPYRSCPGVGPVMW